MAGMGAVSIISGSSPDTANVWNRARGRRPCAWAYSSEVMSTAAAPSLICEALPAVTTQGSSG